MDKNIPFNKPYLTGKEAHYLYQAVYSGKISGNGMFTKRCQAFFESKFGINKALLTSSCTDALEMCGILMDLEPGDEIIMPSFTFVSTSNAFILRGAVIRFSDSYPDNPNIDPSKIEALINEKTKAIVVVHYAGIACDMDPIMEIAEKYNLVVVEDAAQAVDSFYKGKALGSIGHLAAFSFHETKNIMSGEGGLLAVNDPKYAKRAEIIWEKGTNRAAFFRGEVDKYGWVDIGSSFLPSEIVAAFLFAQLENLEDIQNRRKNHWNQYYKGLSALQSSRKLQLPIVPDYATNNAHMFFVVCKSLEERFELIEYLKSKNIYAVFHYISLHKSQYYHDKHDGRELTNCDHFSDCLLRLPLFYELTEEDVDRITGAINQFYGM
jgi:dTDP-4-amino-4,6-dideoxygalactose transaminase